VRNPRDGVRLIVKKKNLSLLLSDPHHLAFFTVRLRRAYSVPGLHDERSGGT
jgi:hypothetical protein